MTVHRERPGLLTFRLLHIEDDLRRTWLSIDHSDETDHKAADKGQDRGAAGGDAVLGKRTYNSLSEWRMPSGEQKASASRVRTAEWSPS
jgi:hypothetical protein